MNHEAVMSGDESHDEAGGHSVKIGVFLKVFAALCVLTAISFAVANSPLMNSKALGWSMMMVVSCAKAFLVISFFMHLRWERTWKYVLTIPTMIMGVLLVVALVPDIAMRTKLYSESRWLHATEQAHAPEHSGEHETAESAETAGAIDGAAAGSSDGPSH